MDENQFAYIISLITEFGTVKKVRVSDANPELTPEDLETPVDNMIEASIFDHAKTGRIINLKGVTREAVSHKLYTF